MFRLLVLILFIAFSTSSTHSASFDCAKATTTNEKLICAVPELSQLDERYAQVYKQAKSQLSNTPEIKQEAIAAFKKRESICADAQCLKNWYQQRIAVLSEQILMPDTCLDPQTHTTLDMNRCAADKVGVAKEVMTTYYTEIIERNSDDPVVQVAIEQSQVAWQAYSEAHCGAVHDKWRDGSIRTIMYLYCELGLVNKRTHVLWQAFATFPDSTPAYLPEPYPLFESR